MSVAANLVGKIAFGLRHVHRQLQARDYLVGKSTRLLREAFGRRFDCLVLSGEERHSGLPLKVMYLGEGKSLEHLQHLFFRGPVQLTPLASLSLLQLARGARPKPQGCDVYLSELTPAMLRVVREDSPFRTPEWVEQQIELHGSWDDVVGRFRRNTRSTDLRKVRKYGFAQDLTNDRESIAHFHDELYLPYVTQRFRGSAELVEREWLIAVARNGALLRILDGERFIAGAVLHYARDYLDWIWVGATRQQDAELEKGCFSALYYHSIRHAHERGYRLMKIGNTRPHLNDGIYRYKRKWGASVVAGRYGSTVWLQRFDYRSEAARRWLEASPFLTQHEDGLQANVFSFDGASDAQRLLARAEEIASPGISAIELHCVQVPAGLPGHIGPCRLRGRLLPAGTG